MKYYTGIGSRQTPVEVLTFMNSLGSSLAADGWCLRSGGADGADKAFEDAALADGSDPQANMEIYLPWKNFNGRSLKTPGYLLMTGEVQKQAEEIAAKFHPAWHNCSHGARALHTRNVFQVLGQDLNTPSKFVVCWTNPSHGGTLQAVRIATDRSIPVFNLALPGQKDRLSLFLEHIAS